MPVRSESGQGLGAQEEKVRRPGRPDGFADRSDLVAAVIVQDDHVAGRERRDQHLFDMGAGDIPIDVTIQEPWRFDPGAAQGGDEG